MSEADSRDVLRGLAEAGIRFWVVGGWGVDALLGEQTRAHHDLDVLVDASDLPALQAWLRAEGFARSHEWTENCPVTLEGGTWDTAFVECHADGRVLDVHAVNMVDGLVRLATTDPWEFTPGMLSGRGRIGGDEVPCASVNGQRAMHVGYDLPHEHRDDLRRLNSLEQ